MHYLKAYVRLVRRAETRIVEDGQNLYEKHHVFPVSLFGKNSRIVLFTLREHYLAHKLLWKACRKRYGYADQKTRKMANAFHWMVYGVGDTNREKNKDSHMYALARIACSEAKRGKSRPDMRGKSYFGADEQTIRNGIESMRVKKIGMKISYPSNRKPSPCSVEKALKISESRKKTKQKFLEMTQAEFDDWVALHSAKPTKDGRINSNVSRALKWRKDELGSYETQ